MMQKMEDMCAKCSHWGLLALRIGVAIVLINHGWPKLFGDTSGMLAFFESTVLPAPGLMLMLAGIIEVFGGLFLLFGIKTRLVATIVVVEFLVIILFVKLSAGLAKMEMDLLVLAIAYALHTLGGGKYAIDHFLVKKKNGMMSEKSETEQMSS